MKKSLIALAVLAASGAALAQSSVTIYGRLDASLGSSKVGNVAAGVGPASVTQLFNSNLTSSRLGFRGTEDLGGGLKAIFAIESGLQVDAPGATTLGDRASFIGLQGGFGTVKLGRHDTSFDDIRDLSVVNNLWDSTHLAPTETIFGASANGAVPAFAGVGGVADYGDRASNQIRYESPNFSGFTFGASYAFDELAAPVKQDITAFNLRYRSGPLDVGYGYQENKNNGALAADALADREFNTLAASYNFGVARVSGGVQNLKTRSGIKQNAYSLGVVVPVGTAVELSAGYASAKAKQAGVTTAKGTAFSLGATYALSKRTRAYVAMTDGDVENGVGVTQRERKIYAVGVRHDF
jgi:predicted porin